MVGAEDIYAIHICRREGDCAGLAHIWSCETNAYEQMECTGCPASS